MYDSGMPPVDLSAERNRRRVRGTVVQETERRSTGKGSVCNKPFRTVGPGCPRVGVWELKGLRERL